MGEAETDTVLEDTDFDERWEQRSRILQSWIEAAALTDEQRMLLAKWIAEAQDEQQRIGQSLRQQTQAHAWSKSVHHYQ